MVLRLRDFIEDEDGWLYAVSTYDNDDRIGCVLRYIPDDQGERINRSGHRYTKYDFDDAYDLIARKKPAYAGLLHRIPHKDVKRILKPDLEIDQIMATNPRVRQLVSLFNQPPGTVGCTGSLLCGLANESSDIDMVVYGKHWFAAQALVRQGIRDGRIEGLSEEMWHKVYDKRKPDITFDTFVLHEHRKWNRGQIDGTYFDILFTRSYDEIQSLPSGRGDVQGMMTIEAKVSNASLAFDNPAIYKIEHEKISRVLSFTHTYSGQALTGETIEARGVCELHGDELWLIVGTTREAHGEYIVSQTLMNQ